MIGEINKDSLQGLEGLNEIGTKDGATKMIREGDDVNLYSVIFFNLSGLTLL